MKYLSKPEDKLFVREKQKSRKASRKKVLDSNGPYIRPNQTEIRNVCLSVVWEFYLSFVCSASTAACNNLCRGLKYLLKVMNKKLLTRIYV